MTQSGHWASRFAAIVFLHIGDPMALGLIESLSRPGQNATGFSDILADLSGKLVDLAKELNKSQSSVSYLWHTDWPDGKHRYALTREAAEKVGLEIRASPITDIAQLNDSIAYSRVPSQPIFLSNNPQRSNYSSISRLPRP